ncbi:S9 family peptidase [Salinimicrobium sp. MT39]|uniref:S9 family peptidase n=1 Tax=Salinimicrobium profundisediminis TaxID=2994553 RepID=A0A9X3CUG0_9FLAO|nr:S9 family peptidase [Salinimicrobium profundisediminis]MCX2837047.1 S9 family peptidase [Salinimicrobium profundisediminis]
MILLFSSTLTKAQEITGTWEGKLNVQGNELPLKFDITKENDSLSGTMDSPLQGAFGLPLDKVELEKNQVLLSYSKIGATYTGTLEGETINGTFKQAGQEFPLVLNKVEKTVPGDPTLPSSEKELEQLSAYDQGNYKYDVKDYFAKPKASSFQFSPDGKFMSYREKDENAKNHVFVKNLETNEITRAIVEKDELVRGYGWANEDRLLYVMDKGGNENYHLYAADVDGSNTIDLTPFEGVQTQILDLLKDDKNFVIVSMNKENAQVFEPYKVNIETGDLEKLYSNDDIANPIMNYLFDKDGTLRGFVRLREGVNMDLYNNKDVDSKEFEIVKQINWKDTFNPTLNYATDYPHDAYVVSNLETDKNTVYLYDLKEDKVIKKLFTNDNYDISGVSLSRHRDYELDYYTFEGEKREIVPISDYYKKLHNRITSEFPDKQYSIADKTDDESKYLVFLQSDKLYGEYWSYDVAQDKFELLYNLMPQLKAEDMAEMRPITFTSRDGKTIHGYITLPKAAVEGQKVPVIVNPHGGPQGIRDSWGFNPEAQLFASRGYATLQVNFRISGGYGREFMESGFKQIGRKAMDDVEDGLKYVIAQGWVDPDKAAIYGGSHGGYAVLRGLTKTPDLYAAGVDYVGVSNLFTFMETIPPYWKPYEKILREIWYDENVPEEKAIMDEVSPVFHIEKIKKPLFVVQGANDPRVNIDESDQIVRALRAKGVDVPYMVKYDEGHGFGKEENRIDLYEAMMGFYAKHLKDEELQPQFRD